MMDDIKKEWLEKYEQEKSGLSCYIPNRFYEIDLAKLFSGFLLVKLEALQRILDAMPCMSAIEDDSPALALQYLCIMQKTQYQISVINAALFEKKINNNNESDMLIQEWLDEFNTLMPLMINYIQNKEE